MEFELSSHEVMRGIAVRRGALVLRPNGWVLAGSAADALVGAVLVGLAVAGGGLWWITAVPGAWLVADGLARLRVAVVATDRDIVARNRWRTHRIAISDVQALSATTVDWWLRKPAYVLTRASLTGSEWLVGTVRAAEGRTYRCDALISPPGLDGDRQQAPTPTEMKIATLRRWIEALPVSAERVGDEHG